MVSFSVRSDIAGRCTGARCIVGTGVYCSLSIAGRYRKNSDKRLNMTLSIDLNCDMGESFGAWKMGHYEVVLPFVTSANIACGFHAGDPTVMRRTVQSALKHNVALGDRKSTRLNSSH